MNFFISKHESNQGPFIFAKRLKNALELKGLEFSKDSINRLNIITGRYEKGSNNILRLDGLYLDSKGKLGDSNKKNKPIFKCYDAFDHIVFQSVYAKKVYEAFTGIKKNNSIIHNGVCDHFFKEIDPVGKPEGFDKVVIASSNWRRHKRIEECINAFKDPRLKNVALVILGGYKNVKQQNVFSLPKIPYNDLPKYYQMADAMIHLCWLDCCPNTVVEGLASGLPVVCSHNGGTPELVKDNGVILKIEEDYEYGTMVDLYHPPKVDYNIITKGILKVLDI